MRPRPCIGHRGPCPTHALVYTTGSRCDTCRSAWNAERDSMRDTTTERGYGARHEALRKKLIPLVKSGHATCWRCNKPIAADSDWDLGHRPDRTYGGPEHIGCNRATKQVKTT